MKTVTVNELAIKLGCSVAELNWLVKHRDKLYSREPMLKPDGTFRYLNKPNERLKRVQRKILDTILFIPSGKCIYGLEKGKEITDNAILHLRRPYLAHFDIKSYFPSIHPSKVRTLFIQIGCSVEVADVLTRLTTQSHELPQGAPTSNKIAALIFKDADKQLEGLARYYGCTYSRYFDDLNFSGRRDLKFLLTLVRGIVGRAGFSLNDRKTKFYSKSEAKVVTGIVLSSGHLAVPKTAREVEDILSHLQVSGTKLTRQSYEALRLMGLISHIRRVNLRLGRVFQVEAQKYLL